MAQANKPGEIIVTKNALEQSSYSYKTENNSNHYYKGLRQLLKPAFSLDETISMNFLATMKFLWDSC